MTTQLRVVVTMLVLGCTAANARPASADICTKCSGVGQYVRGLSLVACDRCGGDGTTNRPLADQLGVKKGAGYETNKFELKSKVEAGGWTVAWADDISETDALEGVAAAGVSIYSTNPTLFYAWVEELLRRTINTLDKSAQDRFSAEMNRQAQELSRQAIIAAIKGRNASEVIRNFDTLDFKAGAIRYSGRNYVGNVTVSRTWGLKPYIAFRLRGSSSGTSNGGGKIEIGAMAREEFRSPNSVVRRTAGNSWIEQTHDGAVLTFNEIGRTADHVELFDATRRMYVRVTSSELHWSLQPSGPWYKVPNSEGQWVR